MYCNIIPRNDSKKNIGTTKSLSLDEFAFAHVIGYNFNCELSSLQRNISTIMFYSKQSWHKNGMQLKLLLDAINNCKTLLPYLSSLFVINSIRYCNDINCIKKILELTRDYVVIDFDLLPFEILIKLLTLK